MGLKLKVKLIQNNIKQNQLAKQVGVTPQYINSLVNGRAMNPSKNIMLKIANELDCTVQELFFE